MGRSTRIQIYRSGKRFEVCCMHISAFGSSDQMCLCSQSDFLCTLSWSGQSRRASTCLTKAADQASAWLGRRRLPSGSSSCCPPTLRRTTAFRISFSLTSLSLKATWTNSRAPSNRWFNVFYCDYRPTTCCNWQELNSCIICVQRFCSLKITV